MIQGLDSLVAEAAIDVAAWRGVKASIPALRALLNRPDPRVFPIGVRLPLRAGAACAILGMTSESEPAERARRVLRGEDVAPPETHAAIPVRARPHRHTRRELGSGG